MNAGALSLGLLLAASTASAVDVGGVSFADRREIAGHSLRLNGAGIREYGVLGIDVYAAALWLVAAQSDAGAVLDSTTPRFLEMHFFHDVSRQDTLRAWDLYLARNCPAPCVLPQAQTGAFRALLPETRKRDVQGFLFEEDAVSISLNGAPLGRIEGGGFARILLSTWIGAVPTTEALKRALLGASRP